MLARGRREVPLQGERGGSPREACLRFVLLGFFLEFVILFVLLISQGRLGR